MNKNEKDSNNFEEQKSSVTGYVAALHVASPVASNISVRIVDEYGDILLEDGLLTYGIESSPGDQLLKILELALVHNKIVKVTKHIHEGTIFIDHIALIRDLS
ncbi:hypothetical protein [Xenorhabdus budapestensis]|uniref:Uncharacterized protein n=1 Tax=Xenorhabdus budapestensis TaxID=290110 RepID=A0A2D0J0A1_XENBU|nr:hypothetical protein [Xenorhabdus budapestensis]PHM27648.1 hypothetical protein Xbud_02228 [Xenorhabdus budapestensis]